MAIGTSPLQDDWGLRAFDMLRAEEEKDWLEAAFVEPAEFAEMIGGHSILVLGRAGSGKTALAQALAQAGAAASGPTTPALIVNWQPSILPRYAPPPQLVQACLENAFDACALALLRHLAPQPALFLNAPRWVQDLIVWFLHAYLQGDWFFHLSRLEEKAHPEAMAWLQALAQRSPIDILSPDAQQVQVIKHLTATVQRLGLAGIWLMVEGLEPWLEIDAESVANMFRTLVSALALFDQPGFVVKLILPADLQAALLASPGIERRRLAYFQLEWTPESLLHLTERRLALALRREDVRLHDVCTDPDLLPWLQQHGGGLPRGWLDLMRPLVAAYRAGGGQHPLGAQAWHDLRRRQPLKLGVDLRRRKVILGYSELADPPPASFRLLAYLYQHRGRYCTRSELYYLGYRELAREPGSSEDKGWEAPESWARIIDTTLWRLRLSIEPDPRQPIYILTDRHRGVYLENTW